MSPRLETAVVVAGIVVAVATLYGLSGDAPAIDPRPPTGPVEASPESIVEVAPAPVVEDLPDAVGRVLAEAGHTERLTASDLAGSLPASVVAVLVDHGATLAVAGDPSP